MNDVGNILGLIPEPPREPEDYIAEDGLLYCGKCHTPKQFRMDEPPFEGRLLPCLCQCQRERREREDAQREKVRHIQAVAELKRRGFTEEQVNEIKDLYDTLYFKGMNVSQAVEYIEANFPATEQRDTILRFIRASKRGIIPKLRLAR